MPSASRARRRATVATLIAAALAALLLGGCSAAPSQAPAPANVTEQCPDRVEPGRDYFPHKVTFDHATGISVAYTDTTKLVEISRPWKDAETMLRLLLVQCGADAPQRHDADMVVEVPVRRLATFSTTMLPALAAIDRLDALVAHGGLGLATTPGVRDAAERGLVAEVGDQTSPDLESLAGAGADVALVSAGIDGDQHRQAFDKIDLAAIPYADWLEETLLGRAEWGKLIALLLNEEAEAQRRFTQIEQRYQQTVARAAQQAMRPTVLVGAPWEGTWYMPAGDSYVARAFAELGAHYPWADTAGTGALSLDIETVLARASDADVWLGAGSAHGTLEDLGRVDERFRALAAFRTGRVYADDAAADPGGGNPIFELGAARPDLLIADLFKALHPGAAADLEFTFYGPVPSGGGQR